jgi:hypothetical protein
MEQIKCQVAMEFLIVTVGVIFFLTFFVIVVQTSLGEKNRDRDFMYVKNLALNVQDEIDIASKASEGYGRNFTLPAKAAGEDYTMIIENEAVHITTARFDVSYPIRKVIGTTRTGVNYIRKQNGEVYLN